MLLLLPTTVTAGPACKGHHDGAVPHSAAPKPKGLKEGDGKKSPKRGKLAQMGLVAPGGGAPAVGKKPKKAPPPPPPPPPDHSTLARDGARVHMHACVRRRQLHDASMQGQDSHRGRGGGLLWCEALANGVASNSTLLYLELAGNGIGPEGAAALAAGVRYNTALARLGLGHNDIGPVGAKAVCGAMAANRNLLWLDVGYNGIGDVGAAAVVLMLRANYTVQVRETPPLFPCCARTTPCRCVVTSPCRCVLPAATNFTLSRTAHALCARHPVAVGGGGGRS
jgi:hypothetical protein